MLAIERRSSRTPFRNGPALVLIPFLMVALRTSTATATDPPSGPVLRLANGGFVPGTLGESGEPDSIRWHGSGFEGPFDFPQDSVETIRWPSPELRQDATGSDSVELTTDDLLFGTLIGLNEEGAILETPDFGPLTIAREFLRRIDRRQGESAPVYFGPNGLPEWKPISKPDSWTEEVGQIHTETGGSSLWLDAAMPTRAAIEIELSWREKPSFVLALGVGEDENSRREGFQFEVWGPDLVVLREINRKAEISWLAKLDEGPGRVRLRVFLDQEAGRLDVVPTSGVSSAELSLSGKFDRPFSGVFLSNIRGDIRLERLIIRQWNGTLPPQIPENTPCVVQDDGSIAVGSPVSLDSSEKILILKTEDGDEERVPTDQAAVIIFAPPPAETSRPVVLALHDGRRLSGSIQKIGNEAVEFQANGINTPLSIPIAAVQTLSVPDRVEPLAHDLESSPFGTFEREDTRLRGFLVPGDEAGRIAWQPLGSATAGRFRPDISGRIVYRETPALRASTNQVRAQVVNGGQVVFNAGGNVRIAGEMLVNRARPQEVPPDLKGATNTITGRMLQLRSGDVIPAEVVSIDEQGVHFQSTHTERTFVPHDRIKALSFAPTDPGASEISEPERDRLLTLPRMQRGNPPTHLIRSRNGDYLRGRLIGMSEQWLRVEVRLSERRIPRAILSEIRWLPPEDDVDPSDSDDLPHPETDVIPPEAIRVLAVRSDGIRLSFNAQQVQDGNLVGSSISLGNCHVPLGEVDRFLLGDAISEEEYVDSPPEWNLRNAPDPQFVQAGGENGGTPGTESALVGAPAPEIVLDLLDGEKFSLADHRGEVVVLDFWATWCGPCLQAMPQIEHVADEFRDEGVRLVAINLQEGPDQISATLKRHQLSMPVALDRDGAIAARYGVTAIPQTVIIDRDGTVARLFIGGGARLADQIRDALSSLTPIEDAPTPPDPDPTPETP